MHEEKLSPTRQQAHVARPCLCSQGGLWDLGDLEDQEDQRVQPGLGHPEKKEKKKKYFIHEKAKHYVLIVVVSY